MASASDKRGAYRAPLDTLVRWTSDGGNWHEDRAKNVSSTGMLILTKHPVDPGASITLSFKLPNLKFEDPIEAEAVVVRVVQRRGQQLDIGLRFISLRSHTYQTVQEFVCRIIGLPLGDTIADLGRREADGYTFEMDRLTEAAEARQAAAAEQRLFKEEAARRQALIRDWSCRGLKAALIVLGLFLLHWTVTFFLDLALRLQGGP